MGLLAPLASGPARRSQAFPQCKTGGANGTGQSTPAPVPNNGWVRIGIPQPTAGDGECRRHRNADRVAVHNVNTAPASAIAGTATIFSRWKLRCLSTGNL